MADKETTFSPRLCVANNPSTEKSQRTKWPAMSERRESNGAGDLRCGAPKVPAAFPQDNGT